MTRLLATCLVAVIMLAACDSGEDVPGAPGGGGNGGDRPDGPRTPAGGVDLSSPAAAVRSFCEAAVAGDIRRTGACIATNAGEGDLRAIKAGKVSQADMEEGKGLAIAGIGQTEYEPGGNGAWVQVVFRNGAQDVFYLVREADGWKVSDF
jgi:hypothetical protein